MFEIRLREDQIDAFCLKRPKPFREPWSKNLTLNWVKLARVLGGKSIIACIELKLVHLWSMARSVYLRVRRSGRNGSTT